MIVKIGANEFDIPSPYGMESFTLVQRLMPVLGRIISMLLSLLGEDPSTADPAKLLEADLLRLLPIALPGLGRIFSDMAPGELEALSRALLKDTKCDGMPLFLAGPAGDAFSSIMRGRTLDTFKLLGQALLVWYPDVFILARGFTPQPPAGDPSKASTTSPASPPASESSTGAGSPSTGSAP